MEFFGKTKKFYLRSLMSLIFPSGMMLYLTFYALNKISVGQLSLMCVLCCMYLNNLIY